MFFTKYPHASNFSFAQAIDPGTGEFRAGRRAFTLSTEDFGGGVFRVAIQNRRAWSPARRIVELEPEKRSPGPDQLRTSLDGFQVVDAKGKVLLSTAPGKGLGISGSASMFQFEVGAGTRFFGMGEKTFGRMELSGLRAKFWNTDVWGDFHFAQWLEHPTDPPYASVPYLIVRQGSTYIGLLLDNPYPTFMETPGRPGGQEVFVEWQRTSPKLILGSEDGEPTIWILVGPSLAELTRKLQKLVGVTPLPPLWALGYHQSRWGYAGEKDLLELDRKFRDGGIPCDGLWLDIDYMRGYRVFTIDPKLFPKGLAQTAAKLGSRKVVAILDPGVKYEPGYEAFDGGLAKGVFCQNVEGQPYVGMVWPGETVFPDFSIDKGRRWWAAKTRDFVRQGFGGFWIDMNDPSTGPVDPTGMRFNAGREPHEAHHNQYALGMQAASYAGIKAAMPSARPFLLSRSAFTGTSRYAAVWTGDNLSNRFYLKMAIPTSVNLALSGIPFNGPDVGGFGGDTNEDLIVDWMKVCFLFPFCRNHTSKGTRPQEPWAFTKKGNTVLRRYIRLRYKFLPYLYQLFVRQEEEGEAILRPMFYDFPGASEDVDDQFMVGADLLQAPLLAEKAKVRKAVLPGTGRWFDARTGAWIKAGTVRLTNVASETPLYVREGAIVPMRPGVPRDNMTDLRRPEFHLFIPSRWDRASSTQYAADDGKTVAYRRGKRSRIDVQVSSGTDGLDIRVEALQSGYGIIRPTFVLHGPHRRVKVNGKAAKLEPIAVQLTGRSLRAWRVKA